MMDIREPGWRFPFALGDFSIAPAIRALGKAHAPNPVPRRVAISVDAGRSQQQWRNWLFSSEVEEAFEALVEAFPGADSYTLSFDGVPWMGFVKPSIARVEIGGR